MKISIITPTHTTKNLPYLMELYDSIVAQTYENWEWILYLNNELFLVDIPEKIQQNPKVKIIRQEETGMSVGYVKNKAFFLGTGEILVEADHDDILLENCLQRLYDVYSSDDEIGFVYSDNATFKMSGEFYPYNPVFGWSYKTFNWRGQELISMDSFDPSSQNVAYIWFGPDHVRSWRSTLYRELQGHNDSYDICDDQELMQRTYLSGTKIHHIPEILYIYRITGENTWIQKNKEIQATTRRLFEIYIRDLAEFDADKNNLLKIDLGGYLGPYGNGYKIVDINENADIVADLNKGIPLEENSVGVVNAHHILEHLDDPVFAMNEIYRVLAHGGWAFIEVPSTDGRGAFQDPTHKNFWNKNSFFYYTNRDFAKFIPKYNGRFSTFKLNDYYPNAFMKKNNILITCAVLVAIKDGPKLPGELKI